MHIQDCIKLLEQILKNNKKYTDPKQQLCYDKGYLIGLISQRMITDSSFMLEIKRLYNNKK